LKRFHALSIGLIKISRAVAAVLLLLLLESFGIGGSLEFSIKQPDQTKSSPASLIEQLMNAPSRILDLDGNILNGSEIRVKRKWTGDRCRTSISNSSKKTLKLSNIIIFELEKTGLDPQTPIYGEGFQMLSQTEGTLALPVDIDIYADRKHYRLAEPEGLRTVYNLFTLDLKKEGFLLLGFTSSRRFAGRFSFSADRLLISMDPEGIEIAPGETWDLEEFTAMSGPDRNILLDRFAKYIVANHPRKTVKEIPTGWCSWYSYGIAGNRSTIEENLELFSKRMPSLKYIQIDEGYSPFEGDWLDKNPAFGSMDSTLDDIRKNGFLPALWVAPFIAEKNARIFREHPDWFVKGDDDKPLDSSTKGYGGWHNDPWYILDGTNPAAQKYLEETFRFMRTRWGITYFKLDANYWGAIAGKHYDPRATRIQAYRLGMEALIRGAGSDAVILGCNAPMWPSLGLVTAMRTSNDIYRKWENFSSTALENLNRGWQNGRLWINDPDCILLAGDNKIPDNEWLFHATAVHAVGGMVLDGDKASQLGNKEWDRLKKSIPPAGIAARFQDNTLGIGVTEFGVGTYYHCFNWGNDPVDRTIRLTTRSKLVDYWTGESMGIFDSVYSIKALQGHGARIILAVPDR
jgi:alpha-galactosidase